MNDFSKYKGHEFFLQTCLLVNNKYYKPVYLYCPDQTYAEKFAG